MLQQTINEQLKAFDEKFGDDKDHTELRYNLPGLRNFLSLSMRRAVEAALEETKLKSEKTEGTYKDGCDCIQCYFIDGFDKAVAEQGEKITKFLEQ